MTDTMSGIQILDTKKEDKSKEKKPSPADVCVGIGSKLELWISEEGEPHATISGSNLLLKSNEFTEWMAGKYYSQQRTIAGFEAIRSAVLILSAAARKKACHKLYRRIANAGNAIYIDLCNTKREAVKVTADSWEVVTDYPVKFFRAGNTGTIPNPASGGSINQLRQFISCEDEQFNLLIGWLLDALKGKSPHLVCAISGEKGTSKSFTCRLFKKLIDPAAVAESSALPKDEAELGVLAGNEYLMYFDNISGISHRISDALCKVSTGGGFKCRKLYSNGELHAVDICRPVILNGIPETCEQPDLMDRTVSVELNRIADEDRKTEGALLTAFDAVRPQVFGALLDALVQGLRDVDAVKVDDLPRMADSARWITACLGSEEWLELYREAQQSRVEDNVEANPIGAYLADTLNWNDPEDLLNHKKFDGTPKELLERLNRYTSHQKVWPLPKGWPTNAYQVGNQLKRIAPSLAKIGWEVDRKKTNGKRVVSIKQNGPETTL